MKIKSNEIATKPIDKGSLIRVDMSHLMAVSATFLLISLRESTCKAKENNFYFTAKAFFVIEITKC